MQETVQGEGPHRAHSPIPEENSEESKSEGSNHGSTEAPPTQIDRDHEEASTSTAPRLDNETGSEQDTQGSRSTLRHGVRVCFNRQISSDKDSGDERKAPLRPHLGANKGNEKDEDQRAIDKYYENNHYTVTGTYAKNLDTMNRIPANYQRILRDLRNREHSIGKQSTFSTKSKALPLPIPGANENRFFDSFYWLAHHHKNIGLRHFFMFSLVFVYTLIGGAIFNSTEAPAEREAVREAIDNIESKLTVLAQEIFENMQDNSTQFSDVLGTRQFLKDAYIELLRAEGRYDQSAYQKKQDNAYLWNYWSASFYSTNLFMTVGYGTISPVTDIGRVLSVLYSIIFVPFSAVVIRDLGQWMLLGCTKIYARILIRWRKARGIETDEDEDIMLPIKYTMMIALVYWLLCALLTWLYDAVMGAPGSGMTYWGSVYFSFITLTAIGLGDLMPNNVPRSPLMKIWYFLGLPVFKVVNRIAYVAMENGVIGTLTVLENKLQRYLSQRRQQKRPQLQHMVSVGQTTTTDVEHADTVNSKPTVRRRGSILSARSKEEQEQINEFLNSVTVRSITSFMHARSDVYGGDFGRVRVTPAQLEDVRQHR